MVEWAHEGAWKRGRVLAYSPSFLGLSIQDDKAEYPVVETTLYTKGMAC